MREYASISPHFWIGQTGKKLRELGPSCQVVALYLISSPHANAIGLYYIPKLLITHETGLPADDVDSSIKSLVAAQFCEYDYNADVVWIYEMAKFQIGKDLNQKDNKVKWIKSEIFKVPKCKLVFDFIEKYKDNYHLHDIYPESCSKVTNQAPSEGATEGATEGVLEGTLEGAIEGGKGENNRIGLEQEIEIEQEQDNIYDRTSSTNKNKKADEYSSAFEKWWSELDKKVQKPRTWKVWQKMVKANELPEVDILVTAYQKLRKKMGNEWKKDGKKWHPHPATMLNNCYWNDVDNIQDQRGSHVGLDEKEYEAGEHRAKILDDLASQ